MKIGIWIVYIVSTFVNTTFVNTTFVNTTLVSATVFCENSPNQLL